MDIDIEVDIDIDVDIDSLLSELIPAGKSISTME